MKKVKAFIMAAAMAVTACLIVTGCTKDRGFSAMKIFTPVYKSTADIRAAIKADEPQPVSEAGKMFIQGNYIFLNEVNRGIHIIDNTNPSAPVNKAFINIPGNGEVFVKGNVLYADSYTDLLAIDISNIQHIQFKSYLHNAFPSRSYVLGVLVPEGMIVADWQVRDTTINLDIQQGQGIWRNNEYFYNGGIFFDGAQGGRPTSIYTLASSSAPKAYNGGAAGSTSRITMVNNYLYTVDGAVLSAINISDPLSPKLSNTASTSINAQTIFALNNTLFLGGAIGMSIFNIDDAAAPVAEGTFGHFCSNDPVIADGNTAYVTLHAGNSCNVSINELDVVDITNIKQPVMLKTYPLTGPIGLSKDGNYLFVCDADGVKIFNASLSTDLKLVKTITVNKPYDVICINKIAYITADKGLYQFDYSDMSNIKQLSKIIMSY